MGKEDEEKGMRERQQGQENLQPVRSRRIVAIDPGRVNLVTALDSQTGKIKTLTRHSYYEKRRINEWVQQKVSLDLGRVHSVTSLLPFREPR
ncbi:hypothetical protein VYU27_006047 [Nannochloropsis oceanica]